MVMSRRSLERLFNSGLSSRAFDTRTDLVVQIEQGEAAYTILTLRGVPLMNIRMTCL